MHKLLKVVNRKKEDQLLDSNNIFFGKLAVWPDCHAFFDENLYIKNEAYNAFEKSNNGYRIIGDNKRRIYNVYNDDDVREFIVTDLYHISKVFEDVTVKITEEKILEHLEYAADIIKFLKINTVKQIKR